MDIREITVLQIDLLKDILKEQEIDLEVADEAMDWLAGQGFNPEFGARPLKRVIQKKVMNKLSKEMLLNKLEKGKQDSLGCCF